MLSVSSSLSRLGKECNELWYQRCVDRFKNVAATIYRGMPTNYFFTAGQTLTRLIEMQRGGLLPEFFASLYVSPSGDTGAAPLAALDEEEPVSTEAELTAYYENEDFFGAFFAAFLG